MLSEIKAGQRIEDLIVQLSHLQLRTSASGKNYLDIQLKDKTMIVPCKMWNADKVNLDDIKIGAIVRINGRSDEFKGNLQIIAEEIILVEEITEAIVDRIYEVAPISGLEMYEQMYAAAEKMEDVDLRRLTCAMLADNREQLLIFPGAKRMHHAQRAGLLYHTYTMLRGAKAFADIYPHLDKDLLYAAVMLHDIGKLREIELDASGIPIDYTKEGKLLGHIISGICMIDEKARQLEINVEITLVLKHTILAHHYFEEYGSPKKPMIAEVEVLYYLDALDARMFQFAEVKEKTEKGAFSDAVYALENRRIYRPDR